MPTLVGTDTQLQIQSDDNLLYNIQELKWPGHTDHPEAPKTRYEDNYAIHQSDSQQNPEPVQGITTEIITELSKVTASGVQGEIFCCKLCSQTTLVRQNPIH